MQHICDVISVFCAALNVSFKILISVWTLYCLVSKGGQALSTYFGYHKIDAEWYFVRRHSLFVSRIR